MRDIDRVIFNSFAIADIEDQTEEMCLVAVTLWLNWEKNVISLNFIKSRNYHEQVIIKPNKTIE